MLFAVKPVASVRPTIRPHKLAVTIFLVFEVLTYILAAIAPREGPTAVHLVVLPVALILAAVVPQINAFAVDVVKVKLTDEHRMVGPPELACPMLLA